MRIKESSTKRMSDAYKKYLFIIGVFAFLFVGVFTANTILFKNTINEFVESYITTRNHHLADHIALNLEMDNYFVEDFTKIMESVPELHLDEEILNNKYVGKELYKMSVITCVDDNYKIYNGDSNLLNWAIGQDGIWDSAKIIPYNNEFIVYSKPVIIGDNIQLALGIELYDNVYKDNLMQGGWEPYIHILVDKDTYEPLIVKLNGIEKLSEDSVYKIVESIKDADNNILFKKGYIVSFENVKNTNWLQVSVEKNTEYVGMFAENIWISIALLVVSIVFFIFLILISKKEVKKKELTYLVDSLTGGLNRDGFIKESTRYINRNNDYEYTIVCLNIKNFRRINEVWTEDIGNQLLKYVYKCISKSINKKELVCRSSRDHFIILMNTSNQDAIVQRVNIILDKINSRVHQYMKKFNIHFYVGACKVVGNDVVTAVGKALSANKQQDKVDICHFYDESIAKKIREENEVIEIFDESLKNGEFEIYLQPKVNKDGGYKAEALVRWVHSRRGVIAPDKFIGLLEKTGKIYDLDLYVFEQVCKLLSEWDEESRIEISVNLSRFSLKEKGEDIWECYKRIKEKYNIADNLIEIELTETGMIEDDYLVNVVTNVIRGFRRSGIKVALDDFGIAYSSLSVLKQLDIDTIKLDKSFFVEETDKSRMIVRNLIRLAHNLNISVVAEGIELVEQCEYLWDSGCDYIQGYVYTKPLPIDEFEKWRRK